MTDQNIISEKANYKEKTTKFFEAIFKDALLRNLGEIEIRALSKTQSSKQNFCRTVEEAVECAYNLCNSGYDVYFGVNPRTDGYGRKKNIKYLIAFHVDVDMVYIAIGNQFIRPMMRH